MITRKPEIGEHVRWPQWPVRKTAVIVARPENERHGNDPNICWMRHSTGLIDCFIWRFETSNRPVTLNQEVEIVRVHGGH
jgi:hypothetical protein